MSVNTSEEKPVKLLPAPERNQHEKMDKVRRQRKAA